MMTPLTIIPGPKMPKYLISFTLRPMNSLSGRRFMVKKNSQTIHQNKIFLLGMTGDIPGVIALINYSGLMSEYG